MTSLHSSTIRTSWRLHDGRLEAGFQTQRAGGLTPGSAEEAPGCLDGGLRAETAIDEARDERGLCLGLTFTTHRSVGQEGPPAHDVHRRNQGMAGPLARGQAVGMRGVEREEGERF